MTPFVDDPDFRLFVGDVRDVLRELPGELRARLLAGVTVSGDPFPKDKQLARGFARLFGVPA